MDTNLGSLVLSIGNQLVGSTGWSTTSQWNFKQPVFVVQKGLTVLEFDKPILEVKKGTYSGEFCISPQGDSNFGTNVEFTTSGDLKTSPEIFYSS